MPRRAADGRLLAASWAPDGILPGTGCPRTPRTPRSSASSSPRRSSKTQKFKTRYATFGFNDPANLGPGAMWPIAYALTELTAAAEARIGALVKKAAS